jgi:hypothetical protein
MKQLQASRRMLHAPCRTSHVETLDVKRET